MHRSWLPHMTRRSVMYSLTQRTRTTERVQVSLLARPSSTMVTRLARPLHDGHVERGRVVSSLCVWSPGIKKVRNTRLDFEVFFCLGV